MPEFKLNGKTYSGSTNYASAISYTEDDGSKITVQDKISELNSNVEELFQSVSNGKALVASAITDKNVPTDATATFEQMATNIRNIETGIDTSGATATSADITEGKTAWVNGELIVGTRPAPVISQTGSISTGTVPNLNSKTLNVTFKEKFETVPKVTASSSNSHITITNIFNITETGFSITVFKDSADTGGFTATIYWTATA